MNSFDPFKKQNLFYEYNLKITKKEISQILFLVNSMHRNIHKTTYNSLNILNIPFLKNLKKKITNILDKHELLLDLNWAQLYNDKDFHGMHTHRGSEYSGILYIKGNSPTMFYNQPYDCFYEHQFKENTLLMFPSLIPHEVRPLKYDEERLIISFNTKKLCK